MKVSFSSIETLHMKPWEDGNRFQVRVREWKQFPHSFVSWGSLSYREDRGVVSLVGSFIPQAFVSLRLEIEACFFSGGFV